MTVPLLGPGDPPPFETLNERGTSRALVVCDHASCRIPAALGSLGISEYERTEHIGWDLGAGNVARRLSALLDAPAILAGFSRLVIDCNRPAAAPDRIPPESDTVPVPGNTGLEQAAVDARIAEIFTPLPRRNQRRPRPHNRRRSAARVGGGTQLHPAACRRQPKTVGNRHLLGQGPPLGGPPDRAATGGRPHGRRQRALRLRRAHRLHRTRARRVRGLPSLLIEIRNSEIRTAEAVETWAARLAGHIRALLELPGSQRLGRVAG